MCYVTWDGFHWHKKLRFERCAVHIKFSESYTFRPSCYVWDFFCLFFFPILIKKSHVLLMSVLQVRWWQSSHWSGVWEQWNGRLWSWSQAGSADQTTHRWWERRSHMSLLKETNPVGALCWQRMKEGSCCTKNADDIRSDIFTLLCPPELLLP